MCYVLEAIVARNFEVSAGDEGFLLLVANNFRHQFDTDYKILPLQMHRTIQLLWPVFVIITITGTYECNDFSHSLFMDTSPELQLVELSCFGDD